jgi:hypothetical protein
MTETPTIDLRNKSSPPADDPATAPLGWRWNKNARGGGRWQPRRSPRGPWSQQAREAHAAARGTRPAPDDGGGGGEDQDDGDGEDPPPAYADTRPRKAPRAKPRVSARTRGEITGAAGLLATLLGPPLSAADPYCGEAIAEQLDAITAAAVPLLCQSHTVVGFFTDTGSDWMLWFKLAMALAPVGVAVTRHHILKTIEIVEMTDDEGKVTGLAAVSRDLSMYAT